MHVEVSPAQPSAELPATVAWQLSRTSGKMKWTGTHEGNRIPTFKHFHIQVRKQQHANARELQSQCMYMQATSQYVLAC